MYGYRVWTPSLRAGLPILQSYVANVYWDSPVLKAEEIMTSLNDGEPHWGIHSYKSPRLLLENPELQENGGHVIGQVKHFGLTYFHQYGYRSANAQIIKLCNYIQCDRCSKPATKIWRYDTNISIYAGYCLCKFHINKRFVGENPILMDVEWYLQFLSDRYQCDIVSLEEFKHLEE